MTGPGRPSTSGGEDVLLEAILGRVRQGAATYCERLGLQGGEARLDRVLSLPRSRIFFFSLLVEKGTGERGIVAKHIRPRGAERGDKREFEALSCLREKESAVGASFLFPLPLDLYPDLSTVVMERCDGEKLSRLVRRTNSLVLLPRGKERLCRTIQRAGRSLRAFHRLSAPSRGCTLWESPVRETLFHKISEMTDALAASGTLDDVTLRDLAALPSLARGRLAGHPFPLLRVHGDFSPANVLVQDQSLALIDFANSHENVAFYDLGRFLAGLQQINPYPSHLLYHHGRVPRLAEHFLAGYGGGTGMTPPEHGALLLFKVLHTVVHCKVRLVNERSRRGPLARAALRRAYSKTMGRDLEMLQVLLR